MLRADPGKHLKTPGGRRAGSQRPNSRRLDDGPIGARIRKRNSQIIPQLIVTVLWYLVITSVLTFIQSRIERKFAKGERGFVAAQA
mgnify:FL=1